MPTYFKHHALLTCAAVVAFSLAGCRSTPPPDDNSLNAAVQSKLASDAAISAEPIQSFVHGGVATLQGNVSSEAAKALAASDASQVAGVRSVVNQLAVQPTAQASVRTTPPAVSQPALPARGNRPPAVIPQRRVSPHPTQISRYDAPTPPQSAPVERRVPQQDQQQLSEPATRPQQQSPPAPAFRNITIPSSTTLSVRITQTLDSATAQPGDAFSGTLASDVVIDGVTALRTGTTVSGRVDQVHEAGHFKGGALLTLSLASINHRGERMPISTDPYTQEGNGRGKNTAEKVGGGAAIGAILGGILGGGKGAAIGAAAGGGAGAGVNGVTRGQQVQIPSETLLRFRLANPVEVRVANGTTSEADDSLQRHLGN